MASRITVQPQRLVSISVEDTICLDAQFQLAVYCTDHVDSIFRLVEGNVRCAIQSDCTSIDALLVSIIARGSTYRFLRQVRI